MVILFPLLFALFVAAVALALFFLGMWLLKSVSTIAALLIAGVLGIGTLACGAAVVWAFLEFRNAYDETSQVVMGAMTVSAAIPTLIALICAVLLVLRSIRTPVGV